MLSEAEYFRKVLGDGFDLIGFDPRGECFADELPIKLSDRRLYYPQVSVLQHPDCSLSRTIRKR